MPISALSAPQSPLPASPEIVPLCEVRVINHPLPPAASVPPTTQPGHVRCILHLRTVLNVASLLAGALVLYWSFGRPLFTLGHTTVEVPAPARADALSGATSARDAAPHAMWRVLSRSWG